MMAVVWTLAVVGALFLLAVAALGVWYSWSNYSLRKPQGEIGRRVTSLRVVRGEEDVRN